MLGMIFLVETSMGAGVKSPIYPPTGVWIKLNINFHRPKLNCERGFGICFLVSVGFEDMSGASERKLCPARGRINERNQLVVEIEETLLARYEGGSTLPNFKDKTTITLADPYTIPEPTCRALGSSTTLTIKPGSYPVSCNNNVYTVVFQL